MKDWLQNWNKFLNEEKQVVSTREELVDLLRDNPDQKRKLDMRKGEGRKSFGGVFKPPIQVEFDYGEFPELINPADGMGWDIILADNSNIDDDNLLPVGHFSYIQDKDLWSNHGVYDMPEKVGGNSKIVLSKDGNISDAEKEHLTKFFEDMWQFKEPEWYTVEEERVLREVTEDELQIVEDILDKIAEDPKWLPFNDIFGDKTRLVINFPTMDRQSELGRFVDVLQNQLGLSVDWNKGTVSAHRRWDDHVDASERVARNLAAGWGANEQDSGVIERSFTMKIGKYLARLENLLKKLYDTKHAVESHKAAHMQSLSPSRVINAIGKDGNKRYEQLLNQLELYLGGTGGRANKYWSSKDREEGDPVSEFAEFADYWQKNAAYIKQNLNSLSTDKYSIIITRHPIDVLRMSDYENITSCHSPPSREGVGQSYYKCAAAEAQGHGAVAYVIETEDLLSETNTSNIESAEQEIQEGEIFYDDQRPQDTGDIRPVSRVRVRKLMYSEDDETGGQDFALPEKRIYGAGIPGIAERVREWGRQTQEAKIENLPTKDGKINLNDFQIYGGSYEDTSGFLGRQELMMLLLQIPSTDFTGHISQNTETEDDLDANLLGDVMGIYESQCREITQEWNNRYANASVDYEVEEDGADGVYISAQALMWINWDADEWTSLPNSWDRSVSYSSDELNGLFGDLFLDRARLYRSGPEIVWECTLNLEHPDFGGQSYMAMPDEFNEMCQLIDVNADDRRDAFKEYLTEYFRREGFIQGAQYVQLAMSIEDGEVDSLEWDVETDGEYTSSYGSYASVSFYYDPEEWKIDPRVLFQILDSRDFKILLRDNMLAVPRRQMPTDYYLDIGNASVVDVGGELKYTIQFQITVDDPDERVELFKELVTGDMDDEDEITRVFNKTLAQIKGSMGSGFWPDDVQESMHRRWTRYLLDV